MTRYFSAVFVLAMLLASGALLNSQDGMTLLLINGKFWTVNPQQKEVEAVAIRGNRIAAVGTTVDILKLKSAGTQVFDLEAKRVLPGFDDSHVHFYRGGAALAGPQLRYSKSQEEFRNTLAEYAKHRPSGSWITGGEWDHENWSPAVLPTHQLIDPVTNNWPVYVSRLDGHEGLANTLAMKLAGVDKNTKDVPGGVIVRDAEGNPTGIFKDAAQSLIERVIPVPSDEHIFSALLAAQKHALENGVTSVQDMGVLGAKGAETMVRILRAYQVLDRRSQLHVRVAAHLPLPEWNRFAGAGVMADFGNQKLQLGAVKGFADGSLGSGTAWFVEPYSDAPENRGIPSDELVHPEQMYKNIREADSAGLQIAIHAIGDRANNTILNFYEQLARDNGSRDRRARIEHAQHLLPSDIPRFGRLHVIASVQPYHCIDDGRWAEKRIGPQRAATTYAFHSLLSAG